MTYTTLSCTRKPDFCQHQYNRVSAKGREGFSLSKGNFNNRRRARRFQCSRQVSLELVSASYDGLSPAVRAICPTINISSSGMLLEVPQRLEPGMILNASVTPSAPARLENLDLVCEIRWQEETSAGDWLTGVFILESDGSDVDQWQRIMTLMDSPETLSTR